MNALKATSNAASRQKSLPKSLLLAVGLLISTIQLFGQGWEKYYGGNTDDYFQSVIQTRDHGFVAVGFNQSGSGVNQKVFVVRTDVDGTEIWSNTFAQGWLQQGYSLIETADKGFLVLGKIFNTQLSMSDVYLVKIDGKGQFQWSKQYGGINGHDGGYRIIRTPAVGGYLLVGFTESFGNGGNDILLVKIDDLGNQQWSKAFGSAGDDKGGRGALAMPDGYLIAGSVFNSATLSDDIYLLKVDFDGEEVWHKFFGSDGFDEAYDLVATKDGNVALVGYVSPNFEYDAYLMKVSPEGDSIWAKTFGGALEDFGYDLLETKSGELVFTGSTGVDAINADILLVKTDADGNLLWQQNHGREVFVDEGYGIAGTVEGGFIIAGNTSEALLAQITDGVLTLTSEQGNIYSNRLQGKVVIDNDNQCDLDPGEPGLNDWIVQAKSSNQTFFGTTDTSGFFDITLDSGTYEVTVLVKNEYWESCVAGWNVTFTHAYDTITRNFPVNALVACPLLDVDVSTPVAQNCTNIGYNVSYCNSGTTSLDTFSIHLILDHDLTLVSSSVPVSSNLDSLYVFEFSESLALGECSEFYFTATSTCDGQPYQAYTVSAHIFPDSFCLPISPTWDMSEVNVNGYCDADSVRFIIRNNGTGDMNAPQGFIVIEDQVMLTQEQPFQLNAGEDTTIVIDADEHTYRLIAEQSPGHPGESYPTIAVEGCSTSGNYSTGNVTMFQEDENDPFVSVDVQEALDSTDFILLRSYPKGYLKNGENLIPANTDIEYHILFQNAGTDTITRVVIRDTLPASLDFGSVVPGASSHLYQFEAYSNGVIKFTLDNIHLVPNGGAASQGFVQFKVSQLLNNPAGTSIPNSAAVFLGFDQPAQTATYTHVVEGNDIKDFIITSDNEVPHVPGVKVKAFPNPFASAIEFETEGKQFNSLTISVFDLNGRLVRQEKSAGNRLRLSRKDLAASTFAYRLEGDGWLLDTGKIIVK